MKKYSILFLVFVIVAGTSSCSKSWLEPAPEDQLSTADSIFSNPANAVKFANACYSNLLTWGSTAFSWIGVTSITSDDADKGSDPGDNGSDKDQMDAITYTATSGSPADIWKSYFLGVGYCNQALANIPQFPALDASLKNRLLGEARFLRAYYYFVLVRTFGAIPLIDTIPDANNPDDLAKASKRVSVDSIYTFIESDLNDAIALLPTKDQYAASDLGRATKGAATGLLSKVYLYEKKWQQAYDLSSQVINGQVGSYGLVSDYASIWRETGENSSESLFEIQSIIGTPRAAVQQYAAVQGIRAGQFGMVGYPGRDTIAVGGWGFNTPSADLDNAYEPNDLRKKATIIHIGDTLFDGIIVKNAANPRHNYKSYVSRYRETYNGNDDDVNKNVRILRMGDIYLINAEAANELGNTGEAQTSLNAVRHRAGLGNTPATGQSELRDAIWKERRVELAMEHDRFYDLIRQGRAGTVLRALGKSFVDGKNELFPIPQVEIYASGGVLTQNPGY